MSYYPEPDSHIKDKVKVVLELSNYATKKELGHATGVETSDLAAKKHFIALKNEVDKLDVNKLVNAPTTLNNLKLKVDGLDVDKLKTVSIDLEVMQQIMKLLKIQNSTHYRKKNNLEIKIPDATTLINMNQ